MALHGGRLLALALGGRLFVELACAELGQKAGLFDRVDQLQQVAFGPFAAKRTAHFRPFGDGRLEKALAEPSLREAAHAALERAGFNLGDRSTEAVAKAWLEIYRNADRWFELYELAEKLVDIDDALAAWRHKHVLTVERIIGNRPGTGGSAGAPYLRATLEKRVFPELWSLRTEL